MSLLAGPLVADDGHMQECQRADLRARAWETGKLEKGRASLSERYEAALKDASFTPAEGLISTQGDIEIPSPGVEIKTGRRLGPQEQIDDPWHFLVMSMMLKQGEQGLFQQKPISDELSELKNAAESQNLREFSRLVRIIQWSSHPPSALTRAIDVALALDMVHVARELVQKGRKLFPSDERLQKAANVLSPPLTLRTRPLQITDFEVSQQWLSEHSSHYRGLWVAVRAGTLLGSAPTLKGLYERIGSEGRTPNTLIVKVLP